MVTRRVGSLSSLSSVHQSCRQCQSSHRRPRGVSSHTENRQGIDQVPLRPLPKEHHFLGHQQFEGQFKGPATTSLKQASDSSMDRLRVAVDDCSSNSWHHVRLAASSVFFFATWVLIPNHLGPGQTDGLANLFNILLYN